MSDEICFNCDEATGNSGTLDDSLMFEGNPFCDECYTEYLIEACAIRLSTITQLGRELEVATAESKAAEQFMELVADEIEERGFAGEGDKVAKLIVGLANAFGRLDEYEAENKQLKMDKQNLKSEIEPFNAGFQLAADATDYDGDWFDAAPIRRLIASRDELENQVTGWEHADSANKGAFDDLKAENKALKEAVRWRVWPDEKPDPDQGIVCDNECWVYLGDGQLQSQSGDLYEFNLSDTWLPIPAEGDET